MTKKELLFCVAIAVLMALVIVLSSCQPVYRYHSMEWVYPDRECCDG